MLTRKCLFGSLIVALGIFTFVPNLSAEEKFEDVLARATKLKEEGQFSKAIAELSWATQQLQKLHAQKLQSFFPETIEGITPEKFQSNAAMGMMVIERPYKTAEGAQIKVTLTGAASSEGGAAQGLGALAGFAQMAAMMDQGGNSETLRIHGQRAQVSDSTGQLTLSLPLTGGMLLNVEQVSGAPSKEKLVAIAEKFDVPGINSYVSPN